MSVTCLQMSRCFPEPADLMAVYRLHRGVDIRDVASAHLAAAKAKLPGFNRFIISAITPFKIKDRPNLFNDAVSLINLRVPELAYAFSDRKWSLPTKIDRVYDSSKGQKALNWRPKYGYESVLTLLDSSLPEVIPVV